MQKAVRQTSYFDKKVVVILEGNSTYGASVNDNARSTRLYIGSNLFLSSWERAVYFLHAGTASIKGTMQVHLILEQGGRVLVKIQTSSRSKS